LNFFGNILESFQELSVWALITIAPDLEGSIGFVKGALEMDMFFGFGLCRFFWSDDIIGLWRWHVLYCFRGWVLLLSLL
jgi:hypothetical protein